MNPNEFANMLMLVEGIKRSSRALMKKRLVNMGLDELISTLYRLQRTSRRADDEYLPQVTMLEWEVALSDEIRRREE